MAYKLFISPCNCISGVNVDYVKPALVLQDSNVFLKSELHLIGIKLDKTFWGVERSFTTRANLLSYLNDSFVSFVGLLGTFAYNNGFITYTNPENFLISEIMAILGTRLLVYKFGSGGAPPMIDYTATLTNGDTIPGTALTGRILQVKQDDGIPIELTTDNLSQDPINLGLTFTQPFTNCNVWVMVSDVPPSGISGGFPYKFPFQL